MINLDKFKWQSLKSQYEDILFMEEQETNTAGNFNFPFLQILVQVLLSFLEF